MRFFRITLFLPHNFAYYIVSFNRRSGGTGRRAGLKIRFSQESVGSIPSSGIGGKINTFHNQMRFFLLGSLYFIVTIYTRVFAPAPTVAGQA